MTKILKSTGSRPNLNFLLSGLLYIKADDKKYTRP